MTEKRTLRSDTIIAEILDVIRPFVEAKKYNPNNSTSIHTRRVMNVKAIDIAHLNALYARLGGE